MIRISKRDKPKLIFMIGIPGSGKTEWIKTHKENRLVISPDEIRKEKTGNISDQSRNKEVWEIAKSRAIKALKENEDVIIDATNIASKFRTEFIKDMPPHILQTKILEGNPEESKLRIKKQLDNGEDRPKVPSGAIDRMFLQFKKECTPEQLEKEGFELID